MQHILKYFLLLLAFLWSTSTMALPTDKQKPAHIDSKSAILNFKTNINTFTGNVIVTQGSTKLTANKLLTYGDSQGDKPKKMNKLIAYGKPAHYQTIPNPGDKTFYASANKIIYFASSDKVILIGDGEFKQGDNTFKAPYITYNRKTGTVTSKATKQQGTTIVIQPNALAKTNASTKTPSKQSK